MKDHPTFLQAAELLLRERKDVRYVCVGEGPPSYRSQLQEMSKDLGLDHWLVWAGARKGSVDLFQHLIIKGVTLKI